MEVVKEKRRMFISEDDRDDSKKIGTIVIRYVIQEVKIENKSPTA